MPWRRRATRVRSSPNACEPRKTLTVWTTRSSSARASPQAAGSAGRGRLSRGGGDRCRRRIGGRRRDEAVAEAVVAEAAAVGGLHVGGAVGVQQQHRARREREMLRLVSRVGVYAEHQLRLDRQRPEGPSPPAGHRAGGAERRAAPRPGAAGWPAVAISTRPAGRVDHQHLHRDELAVEDLGAELAVDLGQAAAGVVDRAPCVVRTSSWVVAIRKAADMPWPVTSPITTAVRPSGRSNQL